MDDLEAFLALTEKDTTADYLTILRDTTALGKKMQRDYDALKQELCAEREKNKALEKELWDFRNTATACINKRQFGFYFIASKGREPTGQEWQNFIKTFSFSFQKNLDNEVYGWIDLNCP